MAKFDVVVIGGGAGGVASACGAAMTGAKVALVEQYGFLGGCATNSSVLAYCGFFSRSRERVVEGVGREFLDRLDRQELYQTHTFANTGNTVVLLDRETTKRTLDEMVADHGVEVFHHTTLYDAESEDTATGKKIRAALLTHRGGLMRLEADQFIDASGDGVLMHRAGARLQVSDVEQRQASTLVMTIGGVAPGNEPSQEDMERALAAYNAQYGANLGISNGTCVRSPLTGELMLLAADAHRDVLDAAELSKAEIHGRQDVAAYHRAFKENLPGFSDSWLAQTGPQIGIRESRRIQGLSTVVAQDVLTARKRPTDGIARCGWPIEDHSRAGETEYVSIEGDGWYHIPFGALASDNVENLWSAGRLVSADARAFASVRVMGTAFATGHAAGVAAATALENPERNAIVATVRARLEEQGALV